MLRYGSYICGKLVYCGLDAFGQIHIIISKENTFVLSKIVKEIEQYKDKEVYLKIAEKRKN